MASIYKRKDSPFYWVAYYPRPGGSVLRESLGTSNRSLAKCQARKIKALQSLQALAHVDIPAEILAQIGISEPASEIFSTAGAAIPSPDQRPRGPLLETLRGYLVRAAGSNTPAHLADKISRLRQFFGSTLIDQVDPRPPCPQRKTAAVVPAFFDGRYLDEILPDHILSFLLSRDYSRASKRHYREVLHGLFRHAVANRLYKSDDHSCPNPVEELPSYAGKDGPIVVLNEEDVAAQYRAVARDPAVHAGCRIMIEAGLRLHEIFVLRRNDVDFLHRLLRLRFPDRGRNNRRERLKTGERTVTLRPDLAKFLADWIPTLKTDWIVPARRGGEWNSHDFGEALREINQAARLPWTASDFRHTYATARLREGWNLATLRHEMGTSLKMLEEHYAGYIPPPVAASLSSAGH
jgi:integrase